MDIDSTRCYTKKVRDGTGDARRIFKTPWFSKAARKALIDDKELCKAIHQVMLGQADDLGGGVFKKRLGRNLYRSIIAAKGGRYWVYIYLFAKKDRANIEDDDLARLREYAALFARKTEVDIAKDLMLEQLVEICNGTETHIQERYR
jgi:hypothetical protein